MQSIPDVFLPAALKDRLVRGHPWVYRNHVPREVRLPSGSWVRVHCGSWAGYALWDASGPIALRLFSVVRPPDAAWMLQRVQAAWELRAPLRATGMTAYRWLFGEGDGLPGLTVDRYGDFAVLQTYMDGADTLVEWLLAALRRCDPRLRGVLLRIRDDRPTTNDDLQARSDDSMAGSRSSMVNRRSSLLWGEPPPDDLIVQEHGLKFHANLRTGQKTGLFLDHRENRRFVEGLSAGRSVLNCFAYTGAFGLYALRGGARGVVNADSGRGLAEAAAANIALNRLLDPARHDFVTADCFDLLAGYAAEGRRFEMIILDPPSFARNKQSRYAALRAYTRINALALGCLVPGGLLVSASCTSQVGPEEFKETLAAAGGQAERRLQIIHEAGQPLDHPAPAHFPEGRYLKFVVARVLDRV